MRTLDAISFPVQCGRVSRSSGDGFTTWHAYPLARDWPAGRVSDAINPRSHGESVLDGEVAVAMRNTLKDSPRDFVLANRGVLLLASGVCHYETGELRVEFDGRPAVMGLADGGTTDAVLASVGEDLPADARVHVEIVTGLYDPDRVAAMVEGRNTSRQVRSSSLANAAGRLDWLKDALPVGIRGRVAWEENSDGVPVSEVLGLLGMFRPGAGKPYIFKGGVGGVGDAGADWEGTRQSHREWTQAAQASYRDRSKLAGRLRDDAVLRDFAGVAKIAETVLMLYDDLYAAVAKFAEARAAKTRSAHKETLWGKVAKPCPNHTTPFGGAAVPRKVPSGWLFPLVGAARQFLEDGAAGKWYVSPNVFYPAIIERGLKVVEDYGVKSKLTAERFASSASSFDSCYISVEIDRLKSGEKVTAAE